MEEKAYMVQQVIKYSDGTETVINYKKDMNMETNEVEIVETEEVVEIPTEIVEEVEEEVLADSVEEEA